MQVFCWSIHWHLSEFTKANNVQHYLDMYQRERERKHFGAFVQIQFERKQLTEFLILSRFKGHIVGVLLSVAIQFLRNSHMGDHTIVLTMECEEM